MKQLFVCIFIGLSIFSNAQEKVEYTKERNLFYEASFSSGNIADLSIGILFKNLKVDAGIAYLGDSFYYKSGLYYRFSKWRISPYAGAQIGLLQYDVGVYGVGEEIQTVSALGLNVLCGVDFYITNSLCIFIQPTFFVIDKNSFDERFAYSIGIRF